MTAKTTRIFKEARPMLWPWCAVTMAGVAPLLQPSHSIAEISPFVCFFGMPLLASLSLGNEFQHRTLSLLLTQPVDRMEIWGEKVGVTVVAVASAVLVFFLSWRLAGLPPGQRELVMAAAYIIATVAAAIFWTLVARSTLGGLVLNLLFPGCMVVVWANLPQRMRNTEYPFSPATNTGVAIAAFVLLCYAGVMIWLGRRTLARFQVTGGMAGDDLLMAGPDVMPGALAGWFRCRPTGAVLNLIRKELRLLRPLWLATLPYVLVWVLLTMFRLVPGRGSTGNLPVTVAMAIVFGGLIAVLAGSLSLGEERTSGTHSWHMTLPVSARRQWLIKLVLALFAGFVCAVLPPVLTLITGGIVFGSPFMFVDPHAGTVWLAGVALLICTSFWCACAVNGTVRAALWLMPVMGALLLAGRFGDWVAFKLMDLVAYKFDLFTNFRFTKAIANIQFGMDPKLVVMVLLVPALLLALVQSYRLFRTQPQDNTLSVVRYLLPLVALVFLCSFSLATAFLFVDEAHHQMWTMFRETREAIEKIQPGIAKLDADHPLQLTAEDLAKTSSLSEHTRRWLANASITVTRDQSYPVRYCCGGDSRSITPVPDKAHSRYLATIHLPSGSDCTVSFQAGRGSGFFGGVCK